jgi:hypothetical protein
LVDGGEKDTHDVSSFFDDDDDGGSTEGMSRARLVGINVNALAYCSHGQR